MNWLNNILDEIKWKAQDFIWAIQDKFKKSDEPFIGEYVEEIEVKPKKKKAKKKNKK